MFLEIWVYTSFKASMFERQLSFLLICAEVSLFEYPQVDQLRLGVFFWGKRKVNFMMFKVVVYMFLMLLPFCSIAEHKVKFLALASEPIAYTEDRVNKGVYVDILKELGSKLPLKSKPKISVLPYSRLLKLVEENQDSFLLTILFPNPQMPSSVIQVAPIVEFENAIISLKQEPLTLKNLKDSNVATIRGTEFSFGEIYAAMVTKKEFNVVPVNRANQGIKMLMKGRVDGYFGPIKLQQYWVSKAGYNWQKDIADPIMFKNTTGHLMIAVGKSISKEASEEFLAKLENAVNLIRDSHFIKQTIQSYIGPTSLGGHVSSPN
jgi:ABC-type amino acid transport substrate-binding protein